MLRVGNVKFHLKTSSSANVLRGMDSRELKDRRIEFKLNITTERDRNPLVCFVSKSAYFILRSSGNLVKYEDGEALEDKGMLLW